ncbi:MAG: molybdopterin-guanine dinucleotide biosynthesis protein B [Parvibaculaceae bacterium]
MTRNVIGIAGYKNAGKTTLVERLVKVLVARGLVVSTVKHAHHDFEIDHEGRDSHRHRMAGAREIAVVSDRLWAVVHTRGDEPEPTLEEMLGRLGPCDLVIVEGYRRSPHPKIEVRDPALGHPELVGGDPAVIAVASAEPLPEERVPVFYRDDAEAVADFVCRHFGLAERMRP